MHHELLILRNKDTFVTEPTKNIDNPSNRQTARRQLLPNRIFRSNLLPLANQTNMEATSNRAKVIYLYSLSNNVAFLPVTSASFLLLVIPRSPVALVSLLLPSLLQQPRISRRTGDDAR